MIHELRLQNYQVFFILGNNLDEQKSKREVILNINIRFLNSKESFDNDDISQTICYSNLTKFIDKIILDKKFNLIETAAQYIYKSISNYISDKNVSIKLELIKRFDNKSLQQASFIISDE